MSSIFRDGAISMSFHQNPQDTSTSTPTNSSACIDDDYGVPYRRLDKGKGEQLVQEPDDAQVLMPTPNTEADDTTELDEEAFQMRIAIHNSLMDSARSSAKEGEAGPSRSSWKSRGYITATRFRSQTPLDSNEACSHSPKPDEPEYDYSRLTREDCALRIENIVDKYSTTLQTYWIPCDDLAPGDEQPATIQEDRFLRSGWGTSVSSWEQKTKCDVRVYREV